jgi:hypothetical protein
MINSHSIASLVAKAISAGSPSVHNRMSVFEKRLLQNRADGVFRAIGQHRIQMTAVTMAGNQDWRLLARQARPFSRAAALPRLARQQSSTSTTPVSREEPSRCCSR